MFMSVRNVGLLEPRSNSRIYRSSYPTISAILLCDQPRFERSLVSSAPRAVPRSVLLRMRSAPIGFAIQPSFAIDAKTFQEL